MVSITATNTLSPQARKQLEAAKQASVKENLVECTRSIAQGQLVARTDPKYQEHHRFAETCCNRAIKVQPENSKAYALLGLSKYFLSFYRSNEQSDFEARELLKEAASHAAI